MRRVLYILGSLNDDDIDWIVEVGEKLNLAANSSVVRQGHPLDFIYIVVDGELEVTIETPDRRHLANLAAGEIIGEVSLLDSRPPMASITTISPTQLLAIPRFRLNSKLEEDTGFAARFYRALGIFLAQRLRNTVGQMGYGSAFEANSLDADQESADELDLDLLDNVSLAGRRFEYILDQLKSR